MKQPTQTEAERKLQLQQKLKGNHQRNLCREYLASLPEDLSRDLGERDFLSVPDFTTISDRFLIRPEGYGSLAVKPEDYLFAEFAWRHKVLEEVRKTDGRHDSLPAFFWPMNFGPIYQIAFGWVRTNFDRLIDDRVGVITVDGSAGIVVDEYAGGWKKLYAENFTEDEKEKIIGAFHKALDQTGFIVSVSLSSHKPPGTGSASIVKKKRQCAYLVAAQAVRRDSLKQNWQMKEAHLSQDRQASGLGGLLIGGN